MDHDVPLRRGGPQSQSGWGACDPATLTATVRQQAQLVTEKPQRKRSHPAHSGFRATLSTLGFAAPLCFLLMFECNRYPVVHVLFRLCCQDQRPPLFGPLRCVYSKGIVGVPEYWNQCRHLIYEHVKILKQRDRKCAQGNESRESPVMK